MVNEITANATPVWVLIYWYIQKLHNNLHQSVVTMYYIRSSNQLVHNVMSLDMTMRGEGSMNS